MVAVRSNEINRTEIDLKVPVRELFTGLGTPEGCRARPQVQPLHQISSRGQAFRVCDTDGLAQAVSWQGPMAGRGSHP